MIFHVLANRCIKTECYPVKDSPICRTMQRYPAIHVWLKNENVEILNILELLILILGGDI